MSKSAEEMEEAVYTTTLPLLKIVDRTLYEPWTHEELQQKAHEHCELERKIDGEEEALKAYTKLKKGEIEVLEEERKALSYALDRGKLVDVSCEVRADVAGGKRLVIRTDTGAIIEESDLTDADRQTALDLDSAGDVFEAMKEALVDKVNAGKLGPNVTAEIVKPRLRKAAKPDEAPSVPSSRILRTKSPVERKGRWKSDAFWKAHDAGLLDPGEDDLTRALVDVGEAGLSEDAMRALEAALDAVEQDCIAEVEEKKIAQAALLAGTFPTGNTKIDVAVGEVRWQRAKLDVALAGTVEG